MASICSRMTSSPTRCRLQLIADSRDFGHQRRDVLALRLRLADRLAARVAQVLQFLRAHLQLLALGLERSSWSTSRSKPRVSRSRIASCAGWERSSAGSIMDEPATNGGVIIACLARGWPCKNAGAPIDRGIIDAHASTPGRAPAHTGRPWNAQEYGGLASIATCADPLGVAFAIGLALFLLLWWRDRGNDFYRPEAAPQSGADQQFEPLPAPLPAGESGGDGHRANRPGRVVAHDHDRNTASPATPAPRPPEARRVRRSPRRRRAPVPISSPAPDYPSGCIPSTAKSGTVLLRVHVGPDGVPIRSTWCRAAAHGRWIAPRRRP